MLHLTELEEKLAQPGAPALQQQMLADLRACALRLRQQLAASVPRAEYAAHQKAIEAVQASIEVLQSWPISADYSVSSPSHPFHPPRSSP